jgi:hypothetical protein
VFFYLSSCFFPWVFLDIPCLFVCLLFATRNQRYHDKQHLPHAIVKWAFSWNVLWETFGLLLLRRTLFIADQRKLQTQNLQEKLLEWTNRVWSVKNSRLELLGPSLTGELNKSGWNWHTTNKPKQKKERGELGTKLVWFSHLSC